MNNKIKRTPLGKSYWNNEGAYQKELDELNERMPLRGAAETLNGELVRAANRLYYDYCNNGNCNVCIVNVEEVETGFINEDGDEEYEDVETREWNGYYEKFYDLILDTCKDALTGEERESFVRNMNKLEDMAIGYEPGFSDSEMQVYDYMVDVVVWYVLSHRDQSLPPSYERK